MVANNDGGKPTSRITDEPKHWIEYGVFAFVFITAIATATAAWYTRREWESSVDNGRRQLRAYVFPDQANLIWQGTARPTVAEIKEAFTTSGPSAHLCRCGSYTAIIQAVQRASTVMAKGR